MEKSNIQEPSRGAMASVAAGILVIIAGFIIYNYFSKSDGEITKESGKTELSEELDGIDNKLLSDEDKTDTILSEKPSELKPNNTTQVSAEWQANQYKNGDIKGSEYKVVKGDTLWQIAQAKYGDPYQWTKIRDANNTGTLSNGNSYIEIGQVLVLPD